ncbi:NACHT, LRR and PYD domains-containing protein 14 isoform X3 [Hydra vulgaris]|uniref:NACHT, LRR and PYD domains-containing protein 14 isoform X3 n=1 Tax=Hydra vulgaris TaxID=6087 RepID=UPI0032E9FAA0
MSRYELISDEFISKCCGEISYEIGSNWFRWGRHLGLSDSDLDNINCDNITCCEKAHNVIKKWKQINGNLSWEQIKKELIAFKRNDIVVEIEKKFGDISEISTALKYYYLANYGKINEIQPLLKAHSNVDLINKFVDLCIVDANDVQIDVVCNVERKKYLEKQMSYTPISYSEIFLKQKSNMLISGVAGIGKTWLLRKCLLDWSNSLIWNSFELVFYLECRSLNQFQNASNVNELLNIFYKDIIIDFNISNHTVLFVIDGLDEFKYLNDLISLRLTRYYPIVKALGEIRKYKTVIAGRVYAIDKYLSMSIEHRDMLTIQVMGFNENGINSYIVNNVSEDKKKIVETTLKESSIAKSMASVPFYLSCMCKIICSSKKIYTNSFLTMTDLYANIFLYFLQKHIIKNNGLVYQMMENENNKKYVLNICRIAFELFVENKFIFSKKEILLFINNFNEVEESFFGFIERVETHLGYHYQFAHLTVMEFCASVYAYNVLSNEEIVANKNLKSCLPMICGLTNENQNSLLKFLVNLNPSNKSCKKSLHLLSVLDRLSKSYNSDDKKEYHDLFIECFYESQSSFTDEIKSNVYEQDWVILINIGKTSYQTSCDSYFVNHFLKSGGRLTDLKVDKSILSDEEKNLLTQCSTNVKEVIFFCLIKLEGWKPKDNIECLRIFIHSYFITKKDFEENFLPWINLCENLHLSLHDDIDFITDIYKWICSSNIKELSIWYGGKEFRNLVTLKNFLIKYKRLITYI